MLDGLLQAFDFNFTSDSKFYSFRCDSKFYDYLPISYWLQVTICTVTRQVFLKICEDTKYFSKVLCKVNCHYIVSCLADNHGFNRHNNFK